MGKFKFFQITSGVMVKDGWVDDAVLEAESGLKGRKLKIGGCVIVDVCKSSEAGTGACGKGGVCNLSGISLASKLLFALLWHFLEVIWDE